jgi:hypothetical protein
MSRISKNLVVLLGALVVMAALAGNSPAQTVIVNPVPQVSYYAPQPYVSYYAPTTVSYYSPAPVYYSAPVVSYYSPPAVSYYTPAPIVAAPATVATYRGILPWRTYSVVNYGGAPVVAAPVVRYYRPFYYYP